MTAVRTISGLQKRALREGLVLVREDGRTFNADGSTSEVPRRPQVKPKAKTEERPQEPPRESPDLSRIAEALERLPSQNHAMIGQPILMLVRVIDGNHKESVVLLKEVLAELARLRKTMEKAPVPLVLESWKFDITRTRAGFIDRISATPVYRPMAKS